MDATSLQYATVWAVPAVLASLTLLIALDIALKGVHTLTLRTRSLPGHIFLAHIDNLIERLFGGKQLSFSLTSVMLGAVLIAIMSCSIILHKLVVMKAEEMEELREEKRRR